MIIITDDWRHMFNDPAFRMGWMDARAQRPWNPTFEREPFYSHGRQMAVECKAHALPSISPHTLTSDMRAIIEACSSFLELLLTEQETVERAKKERAELAARVNRLAKMPDDARAEQIRARAAAAGVTLEGKV